MILRNSALSRRTVLRGLGASVALPMLDAMIPAFGREARAATAPLQRMGFLYIANGANMSRWTPRTVGTLELSPILSPLAPFRDQVLVANAERFVTVLTQQLLAYGVGRGLEHYDMPIVRQIVRDAASDEYRLASVVQGVVRSRPFQMRRAQP